jgi:hypothetical protein
MVAMAKKWSTLERPKKEPIDDKKAKKLTKSAGDIVIEELVKERLNNKVSGESRQETIKKFQKIRDQITKQSLERIKEEKRKQYEDNNTSD